MRGRGLFAIPAALLTLAALGIVLVMPRSPSPPTSPTSGSPAPLAGEGEGGGAPSLAIRVSGNRLVNSAGTPIRLLGVNRSGTEYSCIGGWGIFDGPNDDASVAAIAGWHANAVRLGLNEDCWLGINGVNPSLSGAAYQAAIVNYVNTLHRHNLYAILELHWNAPGSALSTGQQPMVDASHGPAFWQSVASTFKNDPAVLFDLYNEPYGVSWSCWRDGCTTPGWQIAGMQDLIDAVRRAGALQPILVGGLDWANDLSQWLRHEPRDPAHALVASFHVYDRDRCNDPECWTVLAAIGRQVPVVVGEVGEQDCGHAFLDRFMAFADAHRISYLAWVWDTWGCGGRGTALISSYDGSPTPYGIGFRTHLRRVTSGA